MVAFLILADAICSIVVLLALRTIEPDKRVLTKHLIVRVLMVIFGVLIFLVFLGPAIALLSLNEQPDSLKTIFKRAP